MSRDRVAPGRDVIVDPVFHRDGNLVVDVTRKPDSLTSLTGCTQRVAG